MSDSSLINWVLDHLRILIPVTVIVVAVLKSLGRQAANGRREPAAEDPDRAERVRRVQEEIRRKIAERRGVVEQPSIPASRERVPPVVRRTEVPPLDPFGGPMRRIVRRIEEAAAELQPKEPEALTVLRRQRELADQMHSLEAARAAEVQRAAQVAAMSSLARRAVSAPELPVRDPWLAQLRDPRDVRRAVVLREILGAPVGLR